MKGRAPAPSADAEALKTAGLAAVFTPKDYDLMAIIADIVEIVQRPKGVKGFQPRPRRWAVERSFYWLGRLRRHAPFETPPCGGSSG